MTKRQRDATIYTKGDVESMLNRQGSKLIKLDAGTIKHKSLITFICIYCKDECSKQWKSVKPSQDKNITAYCKICARIVAQKNTKKSKENKKIQKNTEIQELKKSIKDNAVEKYCVNCHEIHPIDYFHHFQTGKIIGTCKIVRLKKSKTQGNAQRKYDEQSLRKLIEADGASLIKIYFNNVNINSITTKTLVDIKCAKCENTDKKRVDAIERTGGFCRKCANDNASKKKSKSSKGKTFKIINRNEEAYKQKRKYTIDDVKNLLVDKGSCLVGDGYDERISTKEKVKFICAEDGCFNVYTKVMRDITRCGPYCGVCSEINRRQKISELKKRPPQIVNDPTKEKVCTECEWLYDMDHFKHNQNEEIETSLCQVCRNKKKPITQKRNQMLLLKEVEDPDTQKKCTSCYMIRDKHGEFCDENSTCNMCRKSGNKSYLKTRARIKKYNDEHADIKICVRCIYKYPTDDFKTPIQKKIGVLCETCREYIFNRNDEIANMYLKIKMDSGPCVDCGLDDVRVLEFDHVDRNTKSNCVSQCKSFDELLKESAKCVMRCGICHRRRTKKQLNFGNGYQRPQKKWVDEYDILP